MRKSAVCRLISCRRNKRHKCCREEKTTTTKPITTIGNTTGGRSSGDSTGQPVSATESTTKTEEATTNNTVSATTTPISTTTTPISTTTTPISSTTTPISSTTTTVLTKTTTTIDIATTTTTTTARTTTITVISTIPSATTDIGGKLTDPTLDNVETRSPPGQHEIIILTGENKLFTEITSRPPQPEKSSGSATLVPARHVAHVPGLAAPVSDFENDPYFVELIEEGSGYAGGVAGRRTGRRLVVTRPDPAANPAATPAILDPNQIAPRVAAECFRPEFPHLCDRCKNWLARISENLIFPPFPILSINGNSG